MTNIKRRLIVVVGATASGKTDLSIVLARRYNAPIVSTDSRQVYRGLPIGTAYPSDEQLKSVEHHFIGELDLTQEFNCGEYERQALERLGELFAEHDTVVAVGGSGLYVRALCEGIDDLPDVDKSLREQLMIRLATEGVESLSEELHRLDPEYYEQVDKCNPARVVRALEVCLSTGEKYSSLRKGAKKERDFEIVKIGVDMSRDVLYERINRRVDIMMEAGLEREARAVLPYRNCNSLRTVGYSEMFDFFDGKTTRDEAVELIKRNTRRYAKRQMTWFRRDADIRWFEPSQTDKIIEYIDGRFGESDIKS
ncbi:MAG: tRNA (adenosine(37)-N6)-dimethylallyltransferase MiaA [Alistipes sp.]|nr:tRNA (adenosine(37)-N6)-dimethylallyltransferase MiaA [Alistipes sp.]